MEIYVIGSKSIRDSNSMRTFFHISFIVEIWHLPAIFFIVVVVCIGAVM